MTGLNKGLLGYRGKRRHCDNGLAWINGSEEIYNRPLRKGEGQGHYLTISVSLGAVPQETAKWNGARKCRVKVTRTWQDRQQGAYILRTAFLMWRGEDDRDLEVKASASPAFLLNFSTPAA